jgi:hypothetical protein
VRGRAGLRIWCGPRVDRLGLVDRSEVVGQEN